MDGKKRYLFDCSPDFREQLKIVEMIDPDRHDPSCLDGIFLTHGHMGHYTGLMHLGRESMNSSKIPVYCMPKMAEFLKSNAPWSQLVELKNIEIVVMNETVRLSESLSVSPILVPHRSEFTETVGFRIDGLKRKLLFIPDIDKFELIENGSIEECIEQVDFALLDGTFFDESEINGRNIREIPHPLICESIKRFGSFEKRDRIYFTHLNHTNPCLRGDSEEIGLVTGCGMHVLTDNQEFTL